MSNDGGRGGGGGGRGGSSPDRSPNDDRSDTMNPNNDAYWHDQTNRESQAEDHPDNEKMCDWKD
jgi:hypothetical protein